ncbi:MAG: FtsX-like permease family protein [Pseudomonadota bacterium]
MLDRKLLRDLWLMKSQVLTIALVVAAGIGASVAQLSTYDSLRWLRASYYEAARFAEVFADVKRAPKAVERQIAAIPGVAELESTVVFDATLDVPGVAEPVIGRMIGLTDARQPQLNRLTLRRGRFIEPGQSREALVSEAFAKARGLRPGDRLAAILNGKREELRIVGVVLSPEYIFSARGGALSDDRSFGVFWMDREYLASAFDMEGAFNHAVMRLAPGASEAAVIAALDRLLEPYGALGAHGRDEQLSDKILSQEISQLRTLAMIFPTIFLGVAAFLLNVVLSRQVATQREPIAALKAMGYGNLAIGLHYLKMVLVIVFLGIVAGIAIGAWLGYYMTGMYTAFFHFPRLTYRVQPWIPLLASGISLVAATAGALDTVRRVASLAPAEAMRPPAPARFKRMLLERIGLGGLLPPQARMVIRTLERRLLRTVLTTFGIASSVAIIVAGTFWGDALDYLIRVQFYDTERQDVSVVFTDPVAGSARFDIEHLPGVLYAEAARSVPVRLRAGHRSYRTAVLGLPPDRELRRLLNADLRPVPLPAEGILLTDRLAERLRVKVGDRIQVEALEGNRAKRDVPVVGLVDELLGISGYMDIRALNRLMNEGDAISSVGVSLDEAQAQSLYARLKEMPKVATVAIKASLLQSFQETTARNVLFYTTIVTVFAGAMTIGVVYNSARISLAERAWELASLRVLGFTRREVSGLLLGELAVELALAIPLGLWLGYLLSVTIVALTHTETFSIPVIITPKTYAYAALVTVVAGIVSALIVRRRVDQLDLVAVLKTRE